MHAPVTFQQFADASPYTDPVDRKKLLFVYRAVEDFAAERRVGADRLSILEVGCGVGNITLPLARLGASVRGLDIDARDVATLTQRARELRFDNLTAAVEDAYTFRHDTRYDVVVASEVIEHILDPDAFLANLVRHLEPGGLVILTTPNGYGPWELSNYMRPHHVARRWNWLRRLAGKPDYVAGTGPDHCQHFTRGKLLKIFHRHGLDVHRFMNSDFVLTISKTMRRHPVFGTFDADFANVVPHWMASGWYVALRLRG
ncbi:MAG TPA: methyltransferase domain-containing protein [Candidatus Krumholzibacteria bacterium]